MKKYLYIAGASLLAIIGLLASAFKAGSNKEKVKTLKKEKKANDKDQEIADNINSLDSDDISSRLQ